MRQLKYQPQHQALGRVHGQEAQQHLPPAQIEQQHGQQQKRHVIGRFVGEQVYVLGPGMVCIVVLTNGSLKKFHVVFAHNPRQRCQPVERKGIQVLKPLPGPVRLIGIQPDQPRCHFDILVVTSDVRVGMVDNIMGNFPEVRIGSHQIKALAQQSVDPALAGERAVNGIVGYVEPHESREQPQQYGHAQHHTRPEPVRKNQAVKQSVTNQKKQGFSPHRPVGVGRQARFGEIRIHAPAGGGEEHRPIRWAKLKSRYALSCCMYHKTKMAHAVSTNHDPDPATCDSWQPLN